MPRIQKTLQLGLEHYNAGRLPEAEAAYRQVLAARPNHPDAWHLLGLLAHRVGQHSEAVELIRRAVSLNPNQCVYHYNQGIVLRDMGRLQDAASAFGRALTLNPNYAEAYNDLGLVLRSLGHMEQAVEAHRNAIRCNVGLVKAHNNLGIALHDARQFEAAAASFRTAIGLQPDYAGAYCNLGLSLRELGRPDEAVAALRTAIRLRPDFAEAHSNLGEVLKDKGLVGEAIAAFRQAIALKPDSPDTHSNLVYALHFDPACDARAIAEEYQRWNRQHAEPLKKYIKPHTNDRSPGRRLRIGYVSPDFRQHPVGRFLLPLLAHHDKSQFEVVAYAQVPVPDIMTQRLHSCTDAWRSIVGLADAQATDLIREDRIDILVDLTMNMAGNRLPVFARKPAPVQVTYLAYCSSTGLETIDYRLSDPYLDPPGGQSLYSERTVCLPETYWCYQPAVASMELKPLAALEKNYITFGCLNNFCKLGEPVLAAWARLLGAVPNSQLLLHALEGSHRQLVRERLGREGIEPARVRFAGKVPLADYLRLYHDIDIAMDTFPYGGGTTTCDALWMGVPVVSLVGDTAVGRGGLSILSNVGCPELVARSPEEYVRIAMELAGDLPRLRELRANLRWRMEASPLMDAARFARNVEAAYREMWRNWCDPRPRR